MKHLCCYIWSVLTYSLLNSMEMRFLIELLKHTNQNAKWALKCAWICLNKCSEIGPSKHLIWLEMIISLLAHDTQIKFVHVTSSKRCLSQSKHLLALTFSLDAMHCLSDQVHYENVLTTRWSLGIQQSIAKGGFKFVRYKLNLTFTLDATHWLSIYEDGNSVFVHL